MTFITLCPHFVRKKSILKYDIGNIPSVVKQVKTVLTIECSCLPHHSGLLSFACGQSMNISVLCCTQRLYHRSIIIITFLKFLTILNKSLHQQLHLQYKLKCTHIFEYMYIYNLSNVSCMFRRTLNHPQGERLSLVQNYLLIVMLFILVTKHKICNMCVYKVIYRYQNNIWLFCCVLKSS